MHAIVIGAGIGGIAAAIRAARLGYSVDVFEAASGPGGKLSSFQAGEYRFDRGPSLFTMPQYVDELFELCGEDPRQHFSYTREEVVCRYFWDDGQQLTAYADPQRFSEEAARIFEVPSDRVMDALLAAGNKYEGAGRIFLEQPLHKVATWASRPVLRSLSKLGSMDLTRTMHEVNERTLRHPRLVQLFDRFATYNGSSPYRAPGVLTVIPSFEHLHGTFIPEGGMYDITSSLVQLAQRQGVCFHFNKRVERVLSAGDRVTGIELQDGTRVPADLLINNADVFGFYDTLLPEAKKPVRTLRQERSTSAVIFYWGVRCTFEELGLHNIFFSKNYEAEFAALEVGEIADDFTIYVNISSKSVEGEGPAGTENWFVMINAPHDQGQDWEQQLKRLRRSTLAKLSSRLKVDVESRIDEERTWTPAGIASDTGSHLGALYGASSNSKWAAFLRHRNQSRQYKNLYFVGGSVHPGGGVPLALLSAKIASQLIPKPS